MIIFADSGFIMGSILEELSKKTINFRKEIKPDSKLKTLLRESYDLIIFINNLNEFEIRRKISREFHCDNLEAKRIFDKVLDSFPSLSKLRKMDIKITSKLINWMLSNSLDFRDGLLIASAQKLEIPFVTSEKKKLEYFKKAYSGVMSRKEFIEKLEKYRITGNWV